MRLKSNFYFMLTLGLLGGLSACSSEEPIDSQTLDMSLVFIDGGIYRRRLRLLITNMPLQRKS